MMGYFHIHYHMTLLKWAHPSPNSHPFSRNCCSKLTRFPHFAAFWHVCIENSKILIYNKSYDFRPVSGQIFLKMGIKHSSHAYLVELVKNFLFFSHLWLLFAKMSRNLGWGNMGSGQVGKVSSIYSDLGVYDVPWASLLNV